MAQLQEIPPPLTELQRYGLALMRLWIAQNRLADGCYVNRRDEEQEQQEALIAYRDQAVQAPWWAVEYIHRGLRIGVATDGRVFFHERARDPTGKKDRHDA